MKKVLHVGCGGAPMPDFLEGYQEVRMDIDETHKPDIVASLLDMGDVGKFDAIYGSHILEHFTQTGVHKVLEEFNRVLNVGGFIVMIVPNLTNIKPTMDVVYESPAGDITGLDMYYGKKSFVDDNPYMAHHMAFTVDTMKSILAEHFGKVEVKEMSGWNLLGIGVKTKGE